MWQLTHDTYHVGVVFCRQVRRADHTFVYTSIGDLGILYDQCTATHLVRDVLNVLVETGNCEVDSTLQDIKVC